MILYLFEITICWSVFLLLYWSLLRKETFFYVNRWYLLISFIAGLILPLANWDFQQTYTPEIVSESLQFVQSEYQTITNNFTPIIDVQHTDAQESPSSIYWLAIIYLIGLLFSFTKIMYGFFKIGLIYFSSTKHIINDIPIRLSSQAVSPFAFLNQIYLHPKELEDSELDKIIKHEHSHVYGMHSLDIIMIAIAKSVLWFHPLVYIYDRLFQLVHEYIADEKVIRDSDLLAYGQLLARQLHPGLELNLAHPMFNTHLQKRFKMMTQTKSQKRKLIKYCSVFPLAIFFMVLFSNQTIKDTITPKETIDQIEAASGLDSTKVRLNEKLIKWGLKATFDYTKVDQKPLLLNCPLSSAEENLRCIENNLIDYIKSNGILSTGLEPITNGNLHISIDEYGNAYRMTAKLEDSFNSKRFNFFNINDKNKFVDWSPAKIKGNPVPSTLIFKVTISRKKHPKHPFYSKIENIEITDSPTAAKNEIVLHSSEIYSASALTYYMQDNLSIISSNNNIATNLKMKVWRNRRAKQVGLLRVVDHMPILENFSTLDVPAKKKETLSVETLYKYIDRNIEYPKIAKKLKINGYSEIEFKILGDGTTEAANININNGAKCGEALRDIIDQFNSENKWIPASNTHRTTPITIALPYTFKFNKYGNRKVTNDGASPWRFSDGSSIIMKPKKDGSQAYHISHLPVKKECIEIAKESEEFRQCIESQIESFFDDVFEEDIEYQKLKSAKYYSIEYSRLGYFHFNKGVSGAIIFHQK